MLPDFDPHRAEKGKRKKENAAPSLYDDPRPRVRILMTEPIVLFVDD